MLNTHDTQEVRAGHTALRLRSAEYMMSFLPSRFRVIDNAANAWFKIGGPAATLWRKCNTHHPFIYSISAGFSRDMPSSAGI